MKIHTTHTKILADQLTPVLLFERIRKKYPCSTLLESFDHSKRNNSYSYIGFDRLGYVKSVKDKIEFRFEREKEILDYPKGKSVSEFLKSIFDRFEFDEYDFSFSTNGFLGYLSYEAALNYHEINFEQSDFPQINYQLYRNFLVFDHFTDEVHLFKMYDLNCQLSIVNCQLNEILHLLKTGKTSDLPFSIEGIETNDMSDEDFIGKTNQAIKHCAIGDTFQIVLSRKFEQTYSGDDYQVYRRLRRVNPSPYLFYFDFGNYKLFGSSPETQLSIKDNIATVNPIAGTYKKTGETHQDEIAKTELLKDEKELAEHVMLVDLARNDLNISGKGAEVVRFCELEEYSHVFHLVSEVKTELKENTNPINLLFETYPAGTLSGAPKHKAMQIIENLENSPREFYGGCIGLYDSKNNCNHAITIRTFKSQNNVLTYRAGAGITINSNPEKENNEIKNKLTALRKSISEASLKH